MAYDQLLGRVLAVGGYDGEDLDENWIWNGSEWELLPPGGLTARNSALMVYDSARDTTVLYGGTINYNAVQETWERGPSGVWTLVSTAGPSPRISTAMVYDAQRGVTVLFGGYSSQSRELGDTWEWDGAVWTQVSDTGPSRRRGHGMAYDSRRGVTVLHGGYGSSQRQTDTWEWNGSTWTLVDEAGFGTRNFTEMSYDERQGQILAFSGDLWAWDGQEWTFLSSSGPGPEVGGELAYDSDRGVTVLFGGLDRGRVVWEWDGQEWVAHRPDDIGSSEGHCMVYDSHRDRFYLFGGRTEDGVSGKTWEWSGDEWILVSESGPAPRWDARMVFDSIRNVTVLFGGGSSGGVRLSDTWEWDGSQWTQVNVSGPAGRRGHMMAFDSRHGEIVLYGGYFARDTWIFYNGRWRYVTGRGPGNRRNAAMVYDPVRDNFVLYGGAYDDFEETDILAETWILGPGGWHRQADVAPGPLAFQAMTFDTDRGVALMHGGAYYDNDGTLRNKLWQWDGEHWTLISDEGPTARRGHAMAYDSVNHEALLFGGWDNQPGLRADTWTYRHLARPTLSIETSCPQSGPAMLSWSCASPGGMVGFGFSGQTGFFRVPNGQPCAGTLITLDPSGFRLLGLAHSDQLGSGFLNGQLTSGACGGYIQMIDAQTCSTSNVLRIE